jgi:hypothetical protein
LAAGGLLAGATLSQLGTRWANAHKHDGDGAGCFLRGTRLLTPDGERNAIDLVNGSSITLHSAATSSEIEYLHVKLAQHDVIIAEGAASETLLVNSSSADRFDNFVEYLRLFSEDVTDEAKCAPVAFGNGRERLMSRLRSAASPWVDRRNKFDKARDRIEEFADPS